MHTDLIPFWECAEALKTDILAKADAVPERLRGVAPKPGDWSALQVVSHLVVAERFVMGYGASGADDLPAPANPTVIATLCAVLSAGIALPAPDIMTPEVAGKSLETLADEWGAVRGDLHDFLKTATPDAPYGVHPYFGTITVRQTIEMLAAHTTYHRKRFPRSPR